MPLRVGDAIRNGRCSRLLPGEVLETEVSLYAGPDEEAECNGARGSDQM